MKYQTSNNVFSSYLNHDNVQHSSSELGEKYVHVTMWRTTECSDGAFAFHL